MSTTTTFSAHSQAAVGRFLQTVVHIDDQARFSPTDIDDAAKESLRQTYLAEAQVSSVNSDVSEDFSGVDAPDVDQIELETPLEAHVPSSGLKEKKLHDLNAQELIERFAAEGLVCAVLKPDAKNLPTVIGDAEKAARRADVVIVDWQIIEENGNNALNLITSILENDRKEGGRLRLIVIYTGEIDLQNIIDQVEEKLKSVDKPNLKRHGREPILHSDTVRIAALEKKTEEKLHDDLNINAKYLVSIAELPQRIIEEFAQMTASLVTNTALVSLALVRENTHALLNKMHKGLDAPFLTHKALLPQPEDASQFLVSLFGEELRSIVGNSAACEESERESIELWMKEHHSSPLTVPNKKSKQVPLNYEMFFESTVENALKDGMEEVSPHSIHKNLTKSFSPESTKAFDQKYNEDFAMITTLQSRYDPSSAPILSLGVIVGQTTSLPSSDKQNQRTDANGTETTLALDYWLCIQPPCDSVRLQGAKAKFAFLRLKVQSGQKFDLIVPESFSNPEKRVRLSYPKSLADCQGFVFMVTDKCVRPSEQDGKMVYLLENESFEYVAEVKSLNAQAIVQSLSSNLSRVGTDVFEWLRLSK